MKRLAITTFVMSVALSTTVMAQDPQTPAKAPAANGATPAAAAIVITPETPPLDLARAAFAAQGGEKFRSVQNMILRGSVQLYPPNSVQSIPGSFSLVTAGPKLRMESDARPAIVFKQIYDGQQSYSSMPNVEMPPLTKFGLGALARSEGLGQLRAGEKVSDVGQGVLWDAQHGDKSPAGRRLVGVVHSAQGRRCERGRSVRPATRRLA